MKKTLIWLILICWWLSKATTVSAAAWWDFQSIDTMKYSRDPSRQFLSDPAELKRVSDQQVKLIAETGATHVAIATPYDEEFLPVLKTWVQMARKYNLKVWFRGNWSGWEGWFEYSGISREEHLAKTAAFIKRHPELFVDGDMFSPCPECENGGPGDPRMNGDAQGYRQFLIDQNRVATNAFKQLGKNVKVNLFSMNGDVAELIMDAPTTKQLGGIVTVDHYVKTPAQMADDVQDYARRSQGQVVLGEFGAPIPDIHGEMTPDEQARWLDETLSKLIDVPELVGLNYWVNVGGSTQLWSDAGEPTPAVAILKKYFQPSAIENQVVDSLGQPIVAAKIRGLHKTTHSNSEGQFSLPYLSSEGDVVISAVGYQSRSLPLSELIVNHDPIQLTSSKPLTVWQRVQAWWRSLFAK